MTSLEASIPDGARLVIDTSVLIPYLTADQPISPIAKQVIDEFIAGGRNEAVISVISAGEILIKPSLHGSARDVAFELMDLPGAQLRSVDFLVAAEAARIRGESRLGLPDAVVVATGVLTSSHVIVTNDQRLAAAVPSVVPEMQVVLLSDLV